LRWARWFGSSGYILALDVIDIAASPTAPAPIPIEEVGSATWMGLRQETYGRWLMYGGLRLTTLEASARSWSEALKRFGRIRDNRLDDLLIAR
jgi:hypothetical protein